MEKLQAVSQPHHLSGGLATYDKNTQPPMIRVFDSLAEKLLWTHTAISNIASRWTNKSNKSDNSNRSFIPTPQEEIALFQGEKARLHTISSAIFEDEEAKNNRSPEASMLTIPIEKKFLQQAQLISIKYLSKYPPKTGQTTAHPRGTDTSLADFFLGEVTIPGTTFSFWDIVANRASQPFLRMNIDKIMPVLCPSLSPYPDLDTPLLSKRLLYFIQTDPVIASRYLCGVDTILHFFGFKLSSAGRISARKKEYKACAGYVKKHATQWQLYQLIHSLYDCGFYELGVNLSTILQRTNVLKAYQVSTEEIQKTVQAFDPDFSLDPSGATAYWDACTEYELALEDGITFDPTLPPKSWVSCQENFWTHHHLYSEFKKGSPPLLEQKMKKGHMYWHLPHLRDPFNTKKSLKKKKAD